MMRYLILGLVTLWVTACAAHDEYYYSTHPKMLQAALEACPKKPSQRMTCEELRQVALKVNQSAYQLRLDPQGYGQKILKLQEKIAQQEAALSMSPQQKELQAALKDNKQQLQQHLAIVKWLESPEG